MSQITDRRLLVSEVSLTGSLTRVLGLAPKTISDGYTTEVGFVPQDMVSVFPEFVNRTAGDDGVTFPPPGSFWSIKDYWEWLSAHSVGAIKELKTLIDTASTAASSALSAASSASAAASSAQATANAAVAQTTAAEGDLGTITWNGTAPNGAITKRYKWFKQGNICTMTYSVKAATAGLSVSQFSVPLPAGAPTPYNLANQANDSWVTTGSGGVFATVAVFPLTAGNSGLYKNSTGGYELRASSTLSVAATYVSGFITYMTA